MASPHTRVRVTREKGTVSPLSTSSSSSRIKLSAEQACRLFGCTPAELRRRVQRGELDGGRDGRTRDVYVTVDPERAEVSASAAAKLLGIATPSVRAAIRAGRLEGRRAPEGWRVPLRALHADGRFPAELRRSLEPQGFVPLVEKQPTSEKAPPPSRLTRPIYVRLSADQADALEQLRGRHGSFSRSVGAAVLAAAGRAQAEDRSEQLAGELEQTRRQLDRSREETEKLRGDAGSLPSDLELFCQGCTSLVASRDLQLVERHDGEAWVHRHSGFRGVVAPETVVARRR